MEKEEKIIEEFFNRGVLISKDVLEKKIDDTLFQKLEAEGDIIVLNSDYVTLIEQQKNIVDWYDLDTYRVAAEKDRDEELYQHQLQTFRQSFLSVDAVSFHDQQQIQSLETPISQTNPTLLQMEENKINDQHFFEADNFSYSSLTELSPTISSVIILVSYQNNPHKYEISDFTNFFLSRYKFLETILRYRQELSNIVTVSRLLAKKEKEAFSIIGLVDEIGETKAGNLIITIEDITGKLKVVFSKNKKELFLTAKDLVVDEVIGVTGIYSEKFLFADSIVWPDIPQTHELKKSEQEEYAIFLSDIHVGSKLFLKEEFEKFLRWINGKVGNETQRTVAQKVKYIFIAGDLVDGVGIYPLQEEELEIKNITQQYEEFTRLIQRIPTEKKIIICPGNHDMIYLAEPQPAFYQSFAPGLFTLPNITLVTNPSLINIEKTEKFSGFDVLLYHGYSFDYYVANVESIRSQGGYHRSDLIMKFLLKRRHLAPSFRSTPYFPAHQEDPLLIKKVPDFFVTGHIHYCRVANYRGVTLISGSCWQGKTTFQEKLGHEPEPARVPLVNLKTREVKILRFG